MPGYELIGKEERNAVNEIFDTKSLFYNGERVKLFEKEFAEYLGVKYAVAVSSGTAAIKTALIAAGVKRGDEVITQAFTFIATVEAIIDIGAIPIVINIDSTLNMDPNELEKAITSKTKVIMPVDMLGVTPHIDRIMNIAKKYNLLVIDDTCEALGAEWDGGKLGSQFDMSCFSFDNGKTITTGEGGMIATNSKEYQKLCLEYRDHGHENNPKYTRGRDTHRIYGFNFRTTELNAAIGREQLKKLDFIVKRNRVNYDFLYQELKQIPEITFREIPKKCKPLSDCLIFSFSNEKKAQRFVKNINKKGLSTKNVPDAIEWHFAKYWDHIFCQYGFDKKSLDESFRASHLILDRSVALPILVKMEMDQLKHNIKIYKEEIYNVI